MVEAVLHYLLLVAVLIGLPLVCAWIGGKGEVLVDVAMPDGQWATIVVSARFSSRVYRPEAVSEAQK